MPTTEPIVVLVRPRHPGNVGAVARAMDNFGVARLWLVDPAGAWNSSEAFDRASFGKHILKAARLVSWREVQGVDLVAGTSGRLGTDFNLTRTPFSPAMLARQLQERPPREVALVFGPEDHGLSNKELLDCDLLVSIPAHEGAPALNLSHAVAVVLAALFEARGGPTLGRFEPMRTVDKAQLLRMSGAAIDRLEFLPPPKAETQRKLWRRLIGKSFLTRREAFALMGFFSQLQKQVGRKEGQGQQRKDLGGKQERKRQDIK